MKKEMSRRGLGVAQRVEQIPETKHYHSFPETSWTIMNLVNWDEMRDATFGSEWSVVF